MSLFWSPCSLKTPLFQPRRSADVKQRRVITAPGHAPASPLSPRRRSLLLTAAGGVGALSALLVKALTLGPAVHRRAAAPLPLLVPGVAGDAASGPRPPLQPLTLHWEDGKWDRDRDMDAGGDMGF